MKMDKLVGERFKERPSECAIDSHALMLRGGYMKYVASGIFTQLPPLRRITHKIEQIIREEMDAIDGQEVLFPVAMPGALWEESGRYQSVGNELLRFKDRNNVPMVLGMTHEEASVQLVREYGQSYLKYPFMIYQVQTKFRDEPRPRGGLIRVREFTMKDGYSFHTSQEDLHAYYQRCYAAYERIFQRVGLKNVVAVAADTGMMGGDLSHEFILLTPIGEDSIALCSECDFRANVETAETILPSAPPEALEELRLVDTPNQRTIEEVCAYLKLPMQQSCKTVVYQRIDTGKLVVLFLRGDYEVNEAKLTHYLGADIRPATLENSGLVAGFIGPVGLQGDCTVLFDRTLAGTGNLVCGGNQLDAHYTGLQLERDCGTIEYHDFAKVQEGGICPKCGKATIAISRGIEIGNIFQLGDKYTKAMGMQYLDKDGELRYPVMGCYGIGVGRLAASVCEESNDAYGPIWPISIAPWQVQLCCMRADDAETKEYADTLYQELLARGVEVLYDDRSVSAGVMFSDADLLGIPIRVIASPRNRKEGCCEIVTRDKSVTKKVPFEQVHVEIDALIDMLRQRVNV